MLWEDVDDIHPQFWRDESIMGLLFPSAFRLSSAESCDRLQDPLLKPYEGKNALILPNSGKVCIGI